MDTAAGLLSGTQPCEHGTQNATGAGRVHPNGIMGLTADDAPDLNELPPEALLLSLWSMT